MLILALVGAVFYIGCQSEEQKYRVLSFFFDGVPVPEGVEAEEETVVGPWGQRLPKDDPRIAEWLARREAARGRTAEQAPQITQITHEPYRRRECSSCHAGGMSMSQVQVKADATMCGSCHRPFTEAPRDQWVHGPVAVGECGLCHEPHQSEHKGLLFKAQPQLCLDCHTDENLMKRPYHQLAASGQAKCSQCHDPHMAGNRLLLVDAGTFKRRRGDPQMASLHEPYSQKKCSLCHKEQASNELVDNLQQVCLSCHGDVVADAPAGTHKGVTEGRCITCHEPHQSARPHLVRTNAQEMCYACHHASITQQESHPPVTRSDCLVCHAGHHSGQDHLLRREVWPLSADWAPPARTETDSTSPAPDPGEVIRPPDDVPDAEKPNATDDTGTQD